MTGAGPGRGTLGTRVAAACLLVALLAVGVSGLVTVRLVSLSAREATRAVLAQEADVVAAQIDDGGLGLARVAEVLRGQDIELVWITGRGRVTGGTPTAERAARMAGIDGVLAGTALSRTATVGGQELLVEARPARDGGIVLVRTAEPPALANGALRRNLTFALLAGVAVAVIVGLLAGRVLARPLRGTAEAARALRSGRRDVRVPERGPAEIAEVAGAVNELRDALARSEARQRTFLMSVSHELRTPLTAVSGFAESLADGVVTGQDVPRVGATVLREAQRLQRLVDDLIELARLEADDFRLDIGPVDLGALVADAAAVWEPRCRAAGVVFRQELPPGPVVAAGDPRRLRQVVDGLAENALRIVPAGAPLVLAVAGAGAWAVLEVRDGGPGLSDEDLAIAFEEAALHRRYRDRRPVGVGGIGLALVQRLVGRMGGTITAQRAPEGGACFRTSLPTASVGSEG
ncbi:MAG: HAMP domain-containing histidine kinase [Pseudonocardia sp.]|nr:HAMP domain-containing histidine kinase [Pseudonocardia sp.]